jgi:hypothetical protein
MRLFDIDKGRVQINPAALWIPEFKKLWNRDKTKEKIRATNEIAYIVFMYDFTSPYRDYSEQDREKKVLRDCFPDEPNWKADKDIEKAIKRFKEFQETANSRLLKAAKIAADKLTEYFREVDSSAASEIVRNLKELGTVVKSLDILEKQVQKEQVESNAIRGGQEVGLFEV